MTSKELNEILNKTRRTPNISLTPEQIEELIKDLELLEKYKRVMCEPIKDIMKELEVLDILKEHIKLIDYCIYNDKIVIYLPVCYREKLKELFLK